MTQNHIYLEELSPSSSNSFDDQQLDPICCKLHVISLDEKPTYEPHMFGATQVFVVAYLHNVPVNITLNLAAAIRRLRKVKEPSNFVG
jgi:hypothetical protein